MRELHVSHSPLDGHPSAEDAITAARAGVRYEDVFKGGARIVGVFISDLKCVVSLEGNRSLHV